MADISGHALVRNEDLTTKVKRFRIVGPGTLGAADHSLAGQAVFLYGDEIELSGFTIDTYTGGQALLIGGDHNRLAHLRIRNPQPAFGVGGIRMIGGTDFRATSCDVVAGDDALQFTPIATPGHPLRDLSGLGQRLRRLHRRIHGGALRSRHSLHIPSRRQDADS